VEGDRKATKREEEEWRKEQGKGSMRERRGKVVSPQYLYSRLHPPYKIT
jgi:hypothetical protein